MAAAADEQSQANGSESYEQSAKNADASKDSDSGKDSTEGANADSDKESGTNSTSSSSSSAKKAPGGPLKAPANPGFRETVDTNALGITMNLFDYSMVSDSTSNHLGSPDTQHINSGKNESNQLLFYAYGTGSSTDSSHWQSGTNPGNGINNFTGAGQGGFYTLQFANQGIVQRELDEDGYPLLNTNATDKSLQYLFNPDTNPNAYNQQDKRIDYTGVNNLFYIEEGSEGTPDEMLVYDSNKSYAYYDRSQGSGGDFQVYNGTYDRNGGSTSGLKVGFFPFNTWWSAADQQRTGREYPEINPTSGNNDVTHHLGLTLNVPMIMPYDGKIHHVAEDGTETDVPMVFHFSGDDDMWVFIDGKLVLDIGGIHQPVSGSIDFETGVVTISKGTESGPIYNNAPLNPPQGSYSYLASGISDTSGQHGDLVYMYNVYGYENGDPTKPILTHTSGQTPLIEGILGDKYDSSNRAGTMHTLQAFYLERGGCDSNLEISTNIHLMTKKKVAVSKAWDPDTPEADKNTTVQVQLIRKAVSRDENPTTHERDVVGYDIVSTDTLDASTNWQQIWSELPAEGYNANTVFDEGDPESNVYCDYTYYVREVPVDGYAPVYSDSSSPNLNVAELTYRDVDQAGADPDASWGAAAPVAADYSPMTITNVPTYIEVEKDWLSQDGAGIDSADHSRDSVWVQLYKQTRVDADNPWDEGVAVGAPVKLDASVDWTHRFKVSETGENVRYYVEEGTSDGISFAPATTLRAAITNSDPDGSLYYHDSTVYQSVEGKYYYWTVETKAGNTKVTRVYDGEEVVKQEDGQQGSYVADELSVPVSIHAEAANIPEDATSDHDYVVTFELKDGIKLNSLRAAYWGAAEAGDASTEGVKLSINYSDNTVNITVPAEKARENAGKSLPKMIIPLLPDTASDLTDIDPMNPAKVAVTSVTYRETATMTDNQHQVAEEGVYYPIERTDWDTVTLARTGQAKAEVFNRPTPTLDVEKKWLNPAANGADTTSHDDDTVYLQLYKQTWDENAAEWSDPEAVFSPVALNKDNNFKYSYEGLVADDHTRYFVLESNESATPFEETLLRTAAGKPYVHYATDYEQTNIQVYKDVTEAEAVQNGTILQKEYRWTAVNEGTEQEPDWTLMRTFDGSTEVKQRGGEVQKEFKTDKIEVKISVPAATSSDERSFAAAVDLGDFLEVSDIDGVTLEGLDGAILDEGNLEVFIPGSVLGEGGQELTLTIPVKLKTGSNLATITTDDPAIVTVAQTSFVLGATSSELASGPKVVRTTENVGGTNVMLTEAGHASATVSNKPLVELQLKKIDTLENADHTHDVLAGAKFAVFKDSGAGNVPDGKYDKDADAVDNQRFHTEDEEFETAGEDGLVKIADLMPGTYWLVEIEAPAGYELMGYENPIRIDVGSDGAITLEKVTLAGETSAREYADANLEMIVSEAASATYVLQVPNVRIYYLPSAGGPGDLPFLFIGALVIAFAIAQWRSPRRFAWQSASSNTPKVKRHLMRNATKMGR